MHKLKTYTAHCQRSQGWWAVHVAEIPEVFAQARRLDQVDAGVRDALAYHLGISAEAFDIQVEVELPADWSATVKRTQALRQEAQARQRAAAAATDQALEVLVAQGGLPVRDAGRILGISFQRVAQLHPRRPKS